MKTTKGRKNKSALGLLVCFVAITVCTTTNSARADWLWLFNTKIINYGETGDELGKSVDVKDGVIAVGVHSANYVVENRGKVEIITTHPDGSVDFVYHLYASDGQEGDALGLDVAASSNVVLAGAPLTDHICSGGRKKGVKYRFGDRRFETKPFYGGCRPLLGTKGNTASDASG